MKLNPTKLKSKPVVTSLLLNKCQKEVKPQKMMLPLCKVL